MTNSREETKLHLLEGEALDRIQRDYLSLLELCMTALLREREKGRDAETVHSLYRKCRTIEKTLYDDDDFIASEYFWPGRHIWAKRFGEAGDVDAALACLEEQITALEHIAEAGVWQKLLPLLPDYIRRKCGEHPAETICYHLVCKAEETVRDAEADFPDDPR